MPALTTFEQLRSISSGHDHSAVNLIVIDPVVLVNCLSTINNWNK